MEKVTSLWRASMGGLMHLAPLTGFGYFNRHCRTQMEKGRKEIRVMLQLFLLGRVLLMIMTSKRVSSHLVSSFISFTFISGQSRNDFPNFSGMCRNAWKEEGRLQQNLIFVHTFQMTVCCFCAFLLMHICSRLSHSLCVLCWRWEGPADVIECSGLSLKEALCWQREHE